MQIQQPPVEDWESVEAQADELFVKAIDKYYLVLKQTLRDLSRVTTAGNKLFCWYAKRVEQTENAKALITANVNSPADERRVLLRQLIMQIVMKWHFRLQIDPYPKYIGKPRKPIREIADKCNKKLIALGKAAWTTLVIIQSIREKRKAENKTVKQLATIEEVK